MLELLSPRAQADLVRLIDARIEEQVGTTAETKAAAASPWMTVAEAATYGRTTPGAIYKRIKRGQLRHHRPEGSPILIHRDDFDGTGRGFPEVVR